ncbi:hypothetical protein M9H77_07234 [Catharanthus roseus]|uniref:Uncharacterized protein n=1 Tax=Catharanthus roseus TaxID=4058 RepID=A0ACC0BUI6_CATRO|nr:hypothetical protein M9H77_07234 [Catharanthus roseus]
MEAKSKQEDYQSKFARDMHNFHHGGGSGFNAYDGNNHGNRNFTSRRHVGVGNFSSYAKSLEHTFYDDYGGYGRTSNEDSCDNMNKKSIEKEEYNEFKEKERMEEKERLVERLCIFGSLSIFSKESEHLECSKEKESELEKSETVKENVCFIEK